MVFDCKKITIETRRGKPKFVLLTVGIRTLVVILDVKRVLNANNVYSGCLRSNNFALSDRKNNNF